MTQPSPPPSRTTRRRSTPSRRRARSPRPRSPSAWASPPRRPRGWSASCASSGSSRTSPTRACSSRSEGTQIALEVLRHHRLLELYLARDLGVPWDRVHDEAEVLEHVLSEELEELIAAKLGNPTVDPHGDPIPTRDLVIEERAVGRAVRARARRRTARSCASPTPTPRCCASWPSAGSRPAPASRSSTSSRSAARCSPASSAARCRSSAAGSPTRCAWRWPRERAARRRRSRRAALARRIPAVPHVSALQRSAPRARSAAASPLLGPAFVAAVAYIDPGNFATNIAGGAKYGYLLVWVIIAANLMAMLVQYLSAKVGVATGRNLPELCRDALPRPVTWGLWVQAEIIAIATDLAEFVGAAIALNLLFGVPPFAAGLMTAVVAFAILALQTRGYRRFELAIAGLLGIVLLGVRSTTCCRSGSTRRRSSAGWSRTSTAPTVGPDRGRHPRRDGDAARRLPALRADAGPDQGGERRRAAPADALPARRRDDRHGPRRRDQPDACSWSPPSSSTTRAHARSTRSRAPTPGWRRCSAAAPRSPSRVALLASGLSSSSVGTYAGQVVMQGFINFRRSRSSCAARSP